MGRAAEAVGKEGLLSVAGSEVTPELDGEEPPCFLGLGVVGIRGPAGQRFLPTLTAVLSVLVCQEMVRQHHRMRRI